MLTLSLNVLDWPVSSRNSIRGKQFSLFPLNDGGLLSPGVRFCRCANRMEPDLTGMLLALERSAVIGSATPALTLSSRRVVASGSARSTWPNRTWRDNGIHWPLDGYLSSRAAKPYKRAPPVVHADFDVQAIQPDHPTAEAVPSQPHSRLPAGPRSERPIRRLCRPFFVLSPCIAISRTGTRTLRSSCVEGGRQCWGCSEDVCCICHRNEIGS